MTLIKHAIDASFSAPWVSRVGKLIINFGALELETYLWLLHLSEAPEKIPEFARLPFAQRVAKLLELVKFRGYTVDWKEEAENLWGEALELAKFRNRIAHNPLSFYWNKGPEEGEPDFIGIVDVGRRDTSKNPLASKAEMDNAINSITILATKLAKQRLDWCVIRDSSQGQTT